MSFLRRRQAEPLERTGAGGGRHGSRPSPPPQPGAMPPLPSPPPGPLPPAVPPACSGPSETEPGERPRPAEAQSHRIVTRRKHLWRSPRPRRPPLRLLFSARRAELSRPIVPRSPRRRQRTHHAGRAPRSAPRPLSSGTPGLPPRPAAAAAAAPAGVPAGPGAAPPSPAAAPPPLRQRPSCAPAAPLAAHLPPPLPPSSPSPLRTTRPFLRPPAAAARTGRGKPAESRPGARQGRVGGLGPVSGRVPRAPSGTGSNGRCRPLSRWGFFPPFSPPLVIVSGLGGWRARLFRHGAVPGERSVFWELPEGPRPPFSLPQEPLLADPAVASCHHT